MFTAVLISNLENLKKALSTAQQKNAAAACAKIGEALLTQEQWRTHDLLREAGLCRADIFFGLAYGVIATDLTTDLFSDGAVVRAAHGACDHLQLMDI
ncbi:hypothetical protein D3C78_1315420 [compost metagenome]